MTATEHSKRIRFLLRTIQRNQARRASAIREAADRALKIHRDTQELDAIRQERKK